MLYETFKITKIKWIGAGSDVQLHQLIKLLLKIPPQVLVLAGTYDFFASQTSESSKCDNLSLVEEW